MTYLISRFLLMKKIKDFNSKFIKLLNKIPSTSNLGEEVWVDWYINAIPSNISMFVDRAQKITLTNNMKEALEVEKILLTLEKQVVAEDRKHANKLTFKEEPKKKTTKDPYNIKGFQKFLKTLSNEMVELKKQVIESSSLKGTFRPFRRNQQDTSTTQPHSKISTADDDEEKKRKRNHNLLKKKLKKKKKKLKGMYYGTSFCLLQMKNKKTLCLLQPKAKDL